MRTNRPRWPTSLPLPAVLTLVALLLLGACAAPGGTADAPGETIAVRVDNNLIPPTSLSIYAVPENGARQRVGVVEPSATRTLRFNPVGTTQQYQFVAETTAGQDIVSNPITVSVGEGVSWDVQANLVTPM